MIDYRLRTERLVKEAADPEVAVILLDVVLGYGSHESPAAALTRAIGEARSAHEGRHVSFVAHVVGTDDDPQQLAVQEEQLRDAGVSTFPTNAQAAAAAAAIVDRGR